MREKINFSIIIPVYNVEKYINECLQSVVCQTYKAFEIILVDDGSTDSSGRVCDEWAETDSRIKVIHQENGGLSAARNRGVLEAVGQYVIFLDSDDIWLNEENLERLHSRLQLTKPDVLNFNYKKYFESKFSESYFQEQYDMPSDLKGNASLMCMTQRGLWIACAWNKVIKRELFEDGRLDFICGINSEDIDWCVRLALQAENFDYIDEVVVGYRQRNYSISKSITTSKLEVVLNNIEKSIILLEQSGQLEKSDYLKSYIGYQVGTLIYNMALIEDKEERAKLIQEAKELVPWMKSNSSRKVKVVYFMSKLAGVCTAVDLLRVVVKIRSRRK